ncbi:hypothetical protein GCM10008908_18620 [Clostridium subterminale]|uniref:Uncharacterized protein n=1 Tax=Clostridium subterminale TaxID=1550 RepID=A0ABN1KP06_CLOSU
MINIIKCEEFEQFILSIQSFDNKHCKDIYPTLNGEEYNKFLSTLRLEKIEYKVEEFNKNKFSNNTPELEDICEEHNSVCNKNKNIIIAFKNQYMYSWIAVYHAKLTGDKICLLEDISDLTSYIDKSKYEYITIVSECKSLKIKEISKIQSLQINRRYKFHFGSLTARNTCSLINLIVKNDIFKKRTLEPCVIIDRLDHKGENITFEGPMKIFPYSKSETGDLRNELTQNPTNLLSIIGHGRDHIFWLTNNGGICGRSLCKKEELDGKFLAKPCCAYTGNCFKHGIELLRAHDVLARHIFVNSCFSLKVEEGLFNDNYNLVYSFLDGHVVSYLGTSFMVAGHECLNYYYAAQILSGISLGDAVSNICRCYYNSRLGHEMSYFLIGDPTNKIYSEKKIKYIDYKIDGLKFKDEYYSSYEICEDTYLIRIKFSDNDVAEKFLNLEYRLQIKCTNNKELYGAFKQEDEHTILEIFSKTIIKKGTLNILFKYDECIRLSTIRKFDYILGVGLYPNSKFKAYLSESKDSALKIAKTYKYKLNELSSTKNLYDKVDKINNRISTLSEMVLKYLVTIMHNKGYSWDDQCLENGLSYKNYENNENDTCPNCGRKLYILNYEHEFYSEMKRKHYCCSTCGIIKDFPSENEGIEIYFEGSNYVKIGEKSEQTIKIINHRNEFMSGYAGTAVSSGLEINIKYEKDDEVQKVGIHKGEEAEVKTSICIPNEILPHTYWLYGIIILNGEIWCIQKDLWVIPQDTNNDVNTILND